MIDSFGAPFEWGTGAGIRSVDVRLREASILFRRPATRQTLEQLGVRYRVSRRCIPHALAYL